jgi:hypothetical protein
VRGRNLICFETWYGSCPAMREPSRKGAGPSARVLDCPVVATSRSDAAPLGPPLRRGCHVGVAARAVLPRPFDVALHLPAVRAGLLITGFARLLRGLCCAAVLGTLVAP